MFDHPYDGAYGDAFYEMDAALRAKFLARAVFTKNTDLQSFSFLVDDVAKNPDAEAIPALQLVALAPKQDTPWFQTSVSTFVCAVTALARLGASLPEGPPDIGPIQMAWRHARHILYSLHRPAITREQYAVETEPHWKTLRKLRAIDVALRIFHGRWRNGDNTTTRFLEWSSSQLLPICRDTISSEHEPVSSLEKLSRYRDLRREHVEFALANIEVYGDRSDLPILTALLDNPVHCHSAIKAARAIESR